MIRIVFINGWLFVIFKSILFVDLQMAIDFLDVWDLPKTDQSLLSELVIFHFPCVMARFYKTAIYLCITHSCNIDLQGLSKK